jgi:glutathione S-transferase
MPCRLFSWEHSHFSGKVRAYLRYKERMGDLGDGFEDILATPELMTGLLMPSTGSRVLPQIQAADGTWVQDSSEIIDFIEARHAQLPVVPKPADAPRQAVAAYLVELLADEWMGTPGYWERWYYSHSSVEPNHVEYNAVQWGSVFAAGAHGDERIATGHTQMEKIFGLSVSRTDPRGALAGLVHPGCTPETEQAWWDSMENILGLLDAHFSAHDFVLGGLPSLGDFGLMGPLYAHVYRDATTGFMLRTEHPIVAEWVERANGMSINARSYGQKLYTVGENGELVGRPATSDGGQWLPDDTIPETLDAVIAVFFEEMWPVLKSTIDKTAAFIASPAHEPGGELPMKSFFADRAVTEHQTGNGALTHHFEIRGVRSRRMVVPYQVWMLQRLAAVIDEATASNGGRTSVGTWLEGFSGGSELFELNDRLTECRVRKEGVRLFSIS